MIIILKDTALTCRPDQKSIKIVFISSIFRKSKKNGENNSPEGKTVEV